MQKPLKIFYICPRIPFPLNDGGAIAMYNMIKGFAQLKHHLTLFCFNTSKHFVKAEDLPQEFKDFGPLISVFVPNHIKAKDALVNLFSNEPYHMSRFVNSEVSAALNEHLKENNYDIIHFDGLQTSVYIDQIRTICRNTPCVLRQHNVEHLIWKRVSKESAPLKSGYLKMQSARLEKYELATIKKFDALVPISEIDAQFFAEQGVNNQFVSETGVDFDRWPETSVHIEEDSLFHIGSLDWMPNQEGVKWFVERVWPKLIKQLPEIKFYIAGKHIPDWIRDYDTIDNVFVVGEVESAFDFMSSKWCMVVPLNSGSGMRIKVIEGMAAKKAIVSTSVGVEGIDCINEQHFMLAKDEDQFVNAIVKLKNNKPLSVKLGQQAREYVKQQFSNTIKVEQLSEYYQQLIRGH